MIDIETLSPAAPVAHRIAVYGEFRQEDARQLAEFAQAQVAQGGGANVLFDLTALADFTLSSVAEELIHLPSLLKWIYGLERIAIVSDEAWMRTAARFESALLPGVSYAVYDDDEADAARAWVMGAATGAHTGAVREIEMGKPGILAFELAGRLDRAESERAVAQALARINETGASRFMLIIRNWHGFDLDRLLSKAVLAGKLDIIRKLERYAIVGGPHWMRRYAEFTGPLVKTEVRAFDLEEQNTALAWLAG